MKHPCSGKRNYHKIVRMGVFQPILIFNLYPYEKDNTSVGLTHWPRRLWR
jgi:hypothetical protein